MNPNKTTFSMTVPLPPTPPTPPPPPLTNTSTGLSQGAIVGIVIGIVCVLGMVGYFAYYLYHKKSDLLLIAEDGIVPPGDAVGFGHVPGHNGRIRRMGGPENRDEMMIDD
jgi:hypothetical protein